MLAATEAGGGLALDDVAGVRGVWHTGATGKPLESDVVTLLEVLALGLLDAPVDGAVIAEQHDVLAFVEDGADDRVAPLPGGLVAVVGGGRTEPGGDCDDRTHQRDRQKFGSSSAIAITKVMMAKKPAMPATMPSRM